MLKQAFRFGITEDRIERIPEWLIRILGLVIAVGPVLTVSVWFYFAGNLTGQIQKYSLHGDVLESLVLQGARKKGPVGDETEYGAVTGG
jgi:hypothetical protein